HKAAPRPRGNDRAGVRTGSRSYGRAARYNCTSEQRVITQRSAMKLPSTMHYVLAREPGPPEVLSVAETAVPAPRRGEVLLRVAYAGVNRPDCVQRAGGYPPPAD